MRKYVILLLATLSFLAASAQEKYFKEAMQQPKVNSFYVIRNDKAKMIDLKKLQDYCRKNNYRMRDYTTKLIDRFGEEARTVTSFEFLPDSEFDSYICSNISMQPFSSFSKRVTVYAFEPNGKNYFKRYDDVMWTGQTQNGKAQGTGNGFKRIDASHYICFMGTFNEGILQGDGTFYTYASAEDKFNSKNLKTQKTTTGKTSEGLTSFLFGKKYGYIDNSGNTVVEPIYASAGNYSGGYALVKDGNVDVKLDKMGRVAALGNASNLPYAEVLNTKKKYPQLAKAVEDHVATTIATSDFSHLLEIDRDFPSLTSQTLTRKKAIYAQDCATLASYYQKAKSAGAAHQTETSGKSFTSDFINNYGSRFNFDPDGKVAVAKQLNDYYTVCDAINFTPSYSYYTSGRPPRFTDRNHPAMLQNAMNLCDGGSADFKGFYTYAKPKISTVLSSLRAKLQQERSNYSSVMRRYRAERDEAIMKLERMSVSDVLDKVSSKGNWSRGRVFDSDDSYTDHKNIYFRGGISLTIHEYHYSRGSSYEHYYYPEYEYKTKLATETEAIYVGYKMLMRKEIEKEYPE